MLLYLLGDVDRINMSFLIMFSLFFFFLQECSNEILHIWNLFGQSSCLFRTVQVNISVFCTGLA